MFKDIIESSPYANSHGAMGEHVGAGALYYMLPYMLKAKVCVCLGSGAGFVPKLMVEAQRDLFEETLLDESKVYLIDANIGPWGRPEYDSEIPGYDEITVIKKLTNDAVDMFDHNINYLHVDADHSYDQVLSDLNNYGAHMTGDWAITIHDTYNKEGGDHPEIGSYMAMVDYAYANGLYYTNFHIGCGTGLIMPRKDDYGYKEMGIPGLSAI
jgi:hypothetical protein